MLFGIVLTIHIVVCIALVAVILLQRSEGGALGMGGGPSGFMTARGAGNLLTRATSILAGTFFVLSLALTLMAGGRTSDSVVDRLEIEGIDPSTLGRPVAPAAPATGGALPGTASVPPAIEAPRPTDSPAAPAPAPATQSPPPAE